MKRYQECNSIEKLWRKRWYIAMPFIFLYRQVSPMKIYRDEVIDGHITHTDEYDIPDNRMLWKLIKGEMQSKMKNYYTMEEVKKRIHDKYGF